MSSFKVYINFLIYKFFNGFLFSLSVFFLVENKSVASFIGIMILQEFYFSYFYTAKKNQVIARGSPFPLFYFFLSSICVFLAFIIVSDNVGIYVYAAVFFNLITYSFYAWHAPINEKQDVTKWVSVENKLSLVSIFTICTTLLLGYIFNVNFDAVILLRLGLFYCFVNIYYFLKINNLNFGGQAGGRAFTKTLDVIVLLFLIKLFYFNSNVQKGEMDGFGIKVFFLGYDILAAIIGLYLRRVIAMSCASFQHVNKAANHVNVVIMFFICLVVLFLDSSSDYYMGSISTLVFVSLALNYNYFTFDSESSVWLLKFMYLFILIVSYFTGWLDVMLLIPLVNFIFSSLTRLMGGKC